jgi:hypothetical protein
VSRHHILPPIVYTPAPLKPKETRRRRNVGTAFATDEADETEETGEVSHTPPARGSAPMPQHQLPVEGVERKVHSTTGNLSDGTLKTLLEAQEQEGPQGPAGDRSATKNP